MITFSEARSNYYQMGWSAKQAAEACGMDETRFILSLEVYKMQAEKKITKVFHDVIMYIER